MHEDEQGETEDRDDDTHAVSTRPETPIRMTQGFTPPPAFPPSGAAPPHRPRRARRDRGRRPARLGERVLDQRRDVEEADPSVEEGRDRDLVRGVERAGEGPAALAGLARQREEREAVEIGRLELERQPGGEVEARDRRRAAIGYASANEIGTRMSG